MRLRFAADVRRSEIDNGKIPSAKIDATRRCRRICEMRVPCFASDSQTIRASGNGNRNNKRQIILPRARNNLGISDATRKSHFERYSSWRPT